MHHFMQTCSSFTQVINEPSSLFFPLSRECLCAMGGPLLRLQGAKEQKHELVISSKHVSYWCFLFSSFIIFHSFEWYIYKYFHCLFSLSTKCKREESIILLPVSLIWKSKMFRKFWWVCNNVLKISSFVWADWSTKMSGVFVFPASLLIHTFGNWREVMYNEKCLLCCVSLAIPYYSQSSIHPFWMYSWIRCITNWCSGFSSLGIWYLVQQHWRGNDWHLVLSVRFITHRKLKINNNIQSDFIYFLHVN